MSASRATASPESVTRSRRMVVVAAAAMAAAVAAVTAVVLLAGSPAGTGDGPAAAGSEPSDPGPVIVNGIDLEYWPAAEVVGRLSMSKGCLLLEGPDGPVVPIWPQGTTWTPSTQELTLGGGGASTRVDGEFRGGGGFYSIDRATADLVGAEAATRAHECSERHGDAGVAIVAPADA